MKKMISLLLSLLLVCCMCSVGASAEVTKLSQTLQKALENALPNDELCISVSFTGYQRKPDEMPSFPDEEAAKEEYKAYITSREAEYINNVFGSIDATLLSEDLGNIVFVKLKASDVEKIAANDAVRYLTDYTPYEPENEKSHPFGDADTDGAMTILDASCIQKRLVSLTAMTGYQEYLGDADADDTLTILDSTVIQKKLAGIIPSLPAEADDGRRFHGIQFHGVSVYLDDFIPIEHTGFTTESDDVFRIEAFSDDDLEYEVFAGGKLLRERSKNPMFRFAYSSKMWGASPKITVKIYAPSGECQTITYDDLKFYGLGCIPDFYIQLYGIAVNGVITQEADLIGGTEAKIEIPRYSLDASDAEDTIAVNYYLDGRLIYTAVRDDRWALDFMETAFTLDTSPLSCGTHILKAEGMYGDTPTGWKAVTLNILSVFDIPTASIDAGQVENINKEPLPDTKAVTFEETYSGGYTYNFVDEQTEGSVDTAKNRAALIRTKAQYDAYLMNYQLNYRNTNGEGLPSYDDAFFEENALIILTYEFNCEQNHAFINFLTSKENTLYIDADEKIHHGNEPYAAPIDSYSVSVNQVKKDDVSHITKLEVY